MADRAANLSISVSDSDTLSPALDPSSFSYIGHDAGSVLPRRPVPVAHPRHHGDDLNEKMCDADVEKMPVSRRASPDMAQKTHPYLPRSPASRHSSSASNDDHLFDQQTHLESKALKILLFLSGPCVLLSGLLCIWSLIVTLFTVITYPLRFFAASRMSLAEELRSLLARSNRLQLRAIYSFDSLLGKSVGSLLAIHVISPFLAIGVALAAWCVAIYWVFAAMIGDPDGTEGGNDGAATVLGLRAYWNMWLCKAMTQ